MEIYKSNSLSIEEVRALYFDQHAILETATKVYRFTHPSAKFYYTFDMRSFQPAFFMAVTSMLDRVSPMPKELKNYYIEQGEKAVEHAKERSHYGTLMHVTFARMIIGGAIDIETVDELVREYLFEKKLQYDAVAWTEELTKDIIAFGQFVVDYDVKPLAIAQLLVSTELGIGGELDFTCEMNLNKYSDKTAVSDRKRVRRLIDFKSGKSGFYENNKIQLEMYRRIWDENFPNYPIYSIANWSGKDWRGVGQKGEKKEPSYNFEIHDGDPCLQKVDHYIELARIDELRPSSYIRKYSGSVRFGQPVLGNFDAIPVEQIITEIMTKRI